MAICTLATLVQERAHWGEQGLRVVLTNGIFDLLHAGHVEYLTRARGLGDRLIVALNSDVSSRALKGPQRPLIPEEDRALLLNALRPVDYVTVFAELTAEHVVAALRPDLYVKGGDYASTPDLSPDLSRLPEARLVLSYGGEVQLLPYSAGRSTTTLIERIVSVYGRDPVTHDKASRKP
ncbi:MAG: ADP-heptose synthase [Chloroflexia bacterium]|nr:ADP-heptose synthase [Chloroflexia bacterium]